MAQPRILTGEVERLRKSMQAYADALLAVGGSVTMWVHVWVCHCTQFAATWKTLAAFRCIGLESRHRRLKADMLNVRKCRHWQTKRRGWAQLGEADNLDLSLLRRGWNPWSRAVTKQRRPQEVWRKTRWWRKHL
jgi:hypothetical protein